MPYCTDREVKLLQKKEISVQLRLSQTYVEQIQGKLGLEIMEENDNQPYYQVLQ